MLERQNEILQPRVLMITPFHHVQRGNSLTSARLYKYLSQRGFHLDLISMEDTDWESQIRNTLAYSYYNIIHGFNAYYFAKVLEEVPDLAWLNLLLTTTGTDLNIDLDGPDGAMVAEVLHKVQKIVVFNDTFRSGLGTRFPQLASSLLTIPQGVDLGAGRERSREEVGLTPDDFIFILPSGLRPVKNIELALNALGELHAQYPQVKLLIVGASIEPDYSRQILAQIDPLDWVFYLGEVPHLEISGWLALGDVVLNTSHSEGQPQAALEAMSLGIPSLLTSVPGNLGIIDSGVEGFYVQNQTELTAAAQRLVTDPGLRQQMGSKARQLIAARFNVEQEIEAYNQVYRQLTGI